MLLGEIAAPDHVSAQVAQTAGPSGLGSGSGFAAQGIELGGFRLFPTLSLGTTYDDNILLRDDNRESDVIATATPSVSINSEWAKHSLQIQASSVIRRYISHSEQNTADYSALASGRLDVTGTLPVTASLGYSHQAEQRGTPGDNASFAGYTEYDDVAGTLGFTKQLNHLIFSVNGSAASYRYDPVHDAGVTFDSSFRNRDTQNASVRLDYQLSALTSFFVTGSGNRIHYTEKNIAGTDRGSKGYTVLIGTKFEITRLIHGEVAIGYLSQSFNDPRFSSFGGLNYNVDVTYDPTALTSLKLTANRSIADSALIGVPGVLLSTYNLRVTHELLRTLIVSANVQYSRDDYRGIDRKQNRFVYGVSLTKIINRYLSATLSAQRQTLSSSGQFLALPYQGNKVSIGLILSK